MHKDTPFKARINGDRCVLVLGDDAIRIEFEKFQRPFIMEYGSIRCVQCFGKTMLINASRDTGLSTYCITSARIRRIHRAVLDRLGEPSATVTPDLHG